MTRPDSRESASLREHQVWRCTAPRGVYEAEILRPGHEHDGRDVVYRNLTWGGTFSCFSRDIFRDGAELIYDPHTGYDEAAA